MPTPSKTQPDETYGAFGTVEPFKAVARRFGLSPNTLRAWWVDKFGSEAFKARGKAIQSEAATLVCISRRVPSGHKKRCTKCGSKKILRLFVKKASSHDGRSCWCVKCWREYQRARDAHGANQKYRMNGRQWLDSLKTGPCVDCGGNFPPCVMDFDHVRGEKVANVSQMIRWSRERVLAEVAKCDLVCANCHRVRTHLTGRSRQTLGGRPRRAA